MSDGDHTFEVRSKDQAGNPDETPARYTWTIDTAAPGAPTVTGVTPVSDTTPTWSWNPAGGGSGTYRYKLDSGDLGSGATETIEASFTPASALSEGSHTLYVQERDAAGNWSAGASFAITVDTTAPVAVVSGAPTGITAQTGATLTIGGADVRAYRYRLDGYAFSASEIPVATKIVLGSLSEGAHTVSVIAGDSAGNWQAEASASTLHWTVDSVVPEVSAGANRTASAVFTQSATASDATALGYLWSKQAGPGDISFGTPTASTTTVSASADGSYTLRFTATDAAGNAAFSEMTLVWDTRAPTVNAAASFADATHVDVSFSENVVGAQAPENYQADQGLAITGADFVSGATYRLTTSLQTAGTLYTITAKSNIVDPAGNAVLTGADTASFTRPPESNRAPSMPALNAPVIGAANLNEVATLSPTFMVNASPDSDGDPVSYSFELSTAGDFSTLVASTSGVAAVDGIASWTVDTQLADNTSYYWRTLANDGYVNSAYMPTGTFFVNTANDPPAGVAVSAPADGTEVTSLTPVLAVTNATDADQDIASYEFAVATDSEFMNIVADTAGITEGESGSTAWTVSPLALSDNTLYFWRGRARDQHGTPGAWTSASFFSNTANDAPGVPTLQAPLNGSFNDKEVTTLTPTLVCGNTGDKDRDTLTYIFEVAAEDTFSGPSKQTSPAIAEGSGSTSWTPGPLTDNTTWYWRVKANDGAADGPWMPTGAFFVNAANNAPATPMVQNPSDNSRIASRAPTLELNAAMDVDHDALTYEFAVFSDVSLSPSTQVAGATDQTTRWSVDPPLQNLRSYFWSARAKDIHNYYSPWTPGISFFIDDDGANDPPSITINAPGPGEAPINAAGSPIYTVSWSASDADSSPTITIYYDGSSGGYTGTEIATGIRKDDAVSHPWNTSLLPDGTYYIYAAIDDQSTRVLSPYAGPIVIDRTPPAPPVLSGLALGNSAMPTWNWSTGGGGSGIFRYKLDSSALDSGATQTSDVCFTPATALSPGQHTLYVQEQDSAGNWSTAGYLSLTIDTSAPFIAGVTANLDSGSFRSGSAIPITIYFSEPVSSSGLSLSLNSGAMLKTGVLSQVSSYSCTYQVAPGESSALLSITSVTGDITDAATNTTNNPAILSGNNLSGRTIIIDTTAPVVSAGTNKTTNAFFTQTATASDEHPLKYAWSKQQGPGEITFGTPNALSTAVSASKDGNYQLRFTATDDAGNSASSDMTLVWDTGKPAAVSATSTSGNGYYRSGSTVDVSVDFSEPIRSAGLAIALSSGATLSTGALTGENHFNASYLVADGENTAALRIVGITGTMSDSGGNSTENPVIPAGRNVDDGKTIVIDTAAPDTAFLSTPANPANMRNGDFNFGSADLTATFECSMDGIGFVPCTSPYSFDFGALPDGDHSFTVRAKDPAGNADSSPVSYTWTITTSAPTASVIGAPPSPTNMQTASLRVGGTDVVAYRYQLDQGSYSGETAVMVNIELSRLSEGAHTLRVIGRDSAGNWQSETYPTVVNWVVDVTAPLFTEISTLQGGSFAGKNELNIAGMIHDAQGTPSLSIEVAAGSLYEDVIAVDQSGAFSYLLREKLAQGSNLIRLIAGDPAGNRTVDVRSITYDPNAPQLTISTPADNSTSGLPLLEVAGTVDENVSTVEVQLFDCQQSPVLRSSQPASLTGFGFSVTPVVLFPGCNTVVVQATDLAGNQGSDKRSVTFDDQSPTLAVIEPGADLRTQVSIMNVKGTVADALSTVAVTVECNSDTFAPAVENGTFSQEVHFTQDAVYHLLVKATDAGGNEALVQRNVIYAKPSRGDINNDGRVDVLDCLIVLRISVGMLPQTDSDLVHGDVAPLVNGVPVSDGVIDIGDAVVILKAIVGLLSL